MYTDRRQPDTPLCLQPYVAGIRPQYGGMSNFRALIYDFPDEVFTVNKLRDGSNYLSGLRILHMKKIQRCLQFITFAKSYVFAFVELCVGS